MRSQLIDATNDNIDSSTWDVDYAYYLDGNVSSKEVDDTELTDYKYDFLNEDGIDDSDLMTDAESSTGGDSFSLAYDENGNMKIGVASGSDFDYNWDGKLRNANYDAKLIKLRYDPMGNRIWKYSSEAGTRKYIVDIVGEIIGRTNRGIGVAWTMLSTTGDYECRIAATEAYSHRLQECGGE